MFHISFFLLLFGESGEKTWFTIWISLEKEIGWLCSTSCPQRLYKRCANQRFVPVRETQAHDRWMWDVAFWKESADRCGHYFATVGREESADRSGNHFADDQAGRGAGGNGGGVEAERNTQPECTCKIWDVQSGTEKLVVQDFKKAMTCLEPASILSL